MEDIDIGDVVQLKSGGPSMTVNHIYKENSSKEKDRNLRRGNAEDGTVYVIYFDDRNEVQEGKFPLVVLKKIS